MNEEFLNQDEVRKAKKTEEQIERLRKRKLSNLRTLLRTPEFRRFYWELLSETGLFRASFQPDAYTTAFCEGKRDIGIKLLVDLNEANVSAFAQIQKEHVDEQKQMEKEALKKETE